MTSTANLTGTAPGRAPTNEKNSPVKIPASVRIQALPKPVDLSNTSEPTTKAVKADSDGIFPCRRCLQDAKMGDELLLTPYDPWFGDSPYRQHGPVFVHSSPVCDPYEADGMLPMQLFNKRLSVRAFDKEHCMVNAEVSEGAKLMESVGRLMGNDETQYIHVHYAGAGCFAARINRA